MRNLAERFESRVLPLFKRRTAELGAMLPQMPFDIPALLAQSLVAQQGIRFSGASSECRNRRPNACFISGTSTSSSHTLIYL
jgi:hypothetical protein